MKGRGRKEKKEKTRGEEKRGGKGGRRGGCEARDGARAGAEGAFPPPPPLGTFQKDAISLYSMIFITQTYSQRKKNNEPADDKVDRIRLSVDGGFSEAKFISRPKFITKEATCVQYLIT